MKNNKSVEEYFKNDKYKIEYYIEGDYFVIRCVFFNLGYAINYFSDNGRLDLWNYNSNDPIPFNSYELTKYLEINYNMKINRVTYNG